MEHFSFVHGKIIVNIFHGNLDFLIQDVVLHVYQLDLKYYMLCSIFI